MNHFTVLVVYKCSRPSSPLHPTNRTPVGLQPPPQLSVRFRLWDSRQLLSRSKMSMQSAQVFNSECKRFSQCIVGASSPSRTCWRIPRVKYSRCIMQPFSRTCITWQASGMRLRLRTQTLSMPTRCQSMA